MPKRTRICEGRCRPKCRQCKLAQDRAYHRANPHVNWASSYRSRMRALGLPAVVESFTYEDVILVYGNRCAYCPDGRFEELDHHVPLAQGGHHSLANVRPSCSACNAKKSKSDGGPGDRRVR